MNPGGKISKVLAIALILWCAGTGCMMVSYASGGDTVAATAESVSPAADQMAGMPACHARRQKNRKVTTSQASAAGNLGQVSLPGPSRSGAMSCCPLTTGSIAAASRPQSNDDAPTQIANTDSQIPNLEGLRNKPIAIPLRLANRAHSYLLGCAFLI